MGVPVVGPVRLVASWPTCLPYSASLPLYVAIRQQQGRDYKPISSRRSGSVAPQQVFIVNSEKRGQARCVRLAALSGIAIDR